MSDELTLQPAPERPERLDLRFAPPARPSASGEVAGEGPIRWCHKHHEIQTDTACAGCGMWICRTCRVLTRGRALCRHCRAGDRWRPPTLLRRSLALGAALLALGLAHRLLVSFAPGLTSPDVEDPALPAALLGRALPAWLREVTWLDLIYLDGEATRWVPLLGVPLLLVGLGYVRSSEGQTLRLILRVVVLIGCAGAAMVLASDEVWRLLF